MPNSNEVSRMPSRQATLSEASDDELASDLDDEDDDALPDDADAMPVDGVKTPAMLRREEESALRKAKLLKKKQARDAMEDQVSRPPPLLPPVERAQFRPVSTDLVPLISVCYSTSYPSHPQISRFHQAILLSSRPNGSLPSFLRSQSASFLNHNTPFSTPRSPRAPQQAQRDPEFAAMLEESEKALGKNKFIARFVPLRCFC